jgi:hypothetical protein
MELPPHGIIILILVLILVCHWHFHLLSGVLDCQSSLKRSQACLQASREPCRGLAGAAPLSALARAGSGFHMVPSPFVFFSFACASLP